MNSNKVHWLIFIVFLFGLAVVLTGYYSALRAGEAITENLKIKNDYYTNIDAIVKTNFGQIRLEFFAGSAPKTVENFIKLAKAGFYDGTKFHRVIKGFMIQGGDPNSKDDDWSDDGKGGPGYVFENEINKHKFVRGILGMANSGPNTNGSQFFIVTATSTPWLDGKYTVFGRVIGGMTAVEKIENLPTNQKNHPLKDAIIESIKIIE